jgi:hypothetical protein
MILFILIAEIFRFPQPWKFLLFAPTFYALSGFLQARQKFCYVYGYKGVFSMTGRRNYSRVKDDQYLQKDRSMAIQIVSRVTVVSSIITLLYYFLS